MWYMKNISSLSNIIQVVRVCSVLELREDFCESFAMIKAELNAFKH